MATRGSRGTVGAVRPIRLLGAVLALVLVVGIVLVALDRSPAAPVPGGDGSCERAATSLAAFADHWGTWRATPSDERNRFWALHEAVARTCPLAGVAYYSTHVLGSYLAPTSGGRT